MGCGDAAGYVGWKFVDEMGGVRRAEEEGGIE